MIKKVLLITGLMILLAGFLPAQTGALPPDAGGGTAPVSAADIKMLENFEFDNPSEYYQIELFDRSDLKLFSTRDSFDGLYALKMQYSLSSDNIWGSRVFARRQFEAPRSLDNFVKGSIMIKGDGTLNTFMIQLVDTDDEIYTYESPSALENAAWQEIVFTRSEFYLAQESEKKDGKLGTSIKEIRFIISNPLTESGSGTIYLDKLQLFFSPEQFYSRKKNKEASTEASEKIFKNSYIDVEYRDINRYRSPGTPGYAKEFTRGDLLWMWFYLNTEYRYSYFLVTGLIGFQGRDFGQGNERWGRYDLFGQDLKLVMDTSEFINFTHTLSVGQVNPTFNRFLFSNNHDYWWEGVELNGKFLPGPGYDVTGYDIFYLKQWNDSNTIGLKTWYTLWDIRLTLSGVMARDNALKQKNDYSFQSKNVMLDQAYLVELNRGINITSDGGFAVIWLTYGHHDYKRYGKVYLDDGNGNLSEVTNEYQIIGDETDLGQLSYNLDSEGNPVYEELEKPVRKQSDMGHLRIRIKGLPFKFLEEDIQAAYIGPYFKPRYSYRPMIISEKMAQLGLLLDLNPWASYQNWSLGLTGKLAESTLPKEDIYYFKDFKSVEWNIGKNLGRLGINFKQNYIWQKNPNYPDERTKSFWLYNYIILSLKFTAKAIANLTLSDVNKRLYASGLKDINLYGTKYNFNFKVYFTEASLVEFDYIKTTPPDADVFANTWELDNLLKVLLHIDFKF